jgi:transcriptional regulator with XRE-family HTH domain
MAVKPSPTTLRRQVGAELRRLREGAGRSAADVAAALGWSDSKLSRIETAHTGVRTADLDRLLELYATRDAERRRIRALAVQSRQKGWWEAYGDALPNAYEAYIGFEAEAATIDTYEAQIVSGLLQTPEYARAVIRTDGVFEDENVLDQRVAVRMARQAVLTRDPPPAFRAILDEAVLRRPIGGSEVLRRQLQRLIDMADVPGVTIQVLPFAVGAHRALAGSFVALGFANPDEHPLVYCEGMTGGVFRSRPDEIRSYRMSFDALRSAALEEGESLEFIATLARGDR